MTRFLHAILLGLVGAGIVHIAILFMLPSYTERDAWSQLSDASDFYTLTPIGGDVSTTPLVRSVDPLFSAIACRFNLEDGVLHVKAPGRVPFWSISVYDRNGQNIFSLNDRTAADGTVDFVVLTPIQTIEVRKSLPEEFVNAVFIEADIDEGIVVLRSFVPDRTWQFAVLNFLNGVDCSPR